jgi:protoporphyrin/coproporphyrin ferrochelatase
VTQTASGARVGVLLTNLGTPDAPTAAALRRYLGEFLWDPRVVEAPRPLWWLALNGVILRTRPKRSAEAYARVWTDEGSPLLVISRAQAAALAANLAERLGEPVKLALGMRYGKPSLAQALAELDAAGIERILVLPLYPQYSATTTASTFDALAQLLRRRRRIPELRQIRDYHAEPGYIEALAESIRRQRVERPPADRLLFSFHGLPRRYADLGDPYREQCEETARLVAQRLELEQGSWLVTFQSRFGPQEWLKPYTDKTLQALAREGVRRVELICPGFAADCLETLEENAMVNRDLFLEAGGAHFHYIPCLNDSPQHIDFLGSLIERHLAGWLATASPR